MSESIVMGGRGLWPPAVSSLLQRVLQRGTAVLLVACGSSAGDDAEATTPSVQGSSDVGSFDDEVASGEAASVVNVWQFDNRHMSKRFTHLHDPRAWPQGTTTLVYSALDADGHAISIEWAYDGHAVTYSYDVLAVAPSFVSFREETSRRSWRATSGEVAIQPLSDGQVRVDFTGLQIAESIGVTERTPEPITDGFVIGEVERVCLEYVIAKDNVVIDTATGEPVPQPQPDDDWSSPYCAQFAL